MTTTFQINSKLGGELAITDSVQAVVRLAVPDVSVNIAVQLYMVSRFLTFKSWILLSEYSYIALLVHCSA